MEYPDSKPLFTYQHFLRSRYSETDKMGYVYYGHFLKYFEVARTEMVRSFGVSYAEMEEKGFMLPVVSAELEYKAPVLYDEEIRIDLELFDVPGIRLNTYYKVYSVKTGQLKTRGKVVLVFMDATSRRPVRAPESFINSLNYALRTT